MQKNIGDPLALPKHKLKDPLSGKGLSHPGPPSEFSTLYKCASINSQASN